MRLKAIKSLVATNIIYTTSPANLARYRKRQNANVTKSLMNSYLLIGILYAVIFGAQAMSVPLVSDAGIFSNFIAMFYLYIFSQGFLSFYNVFYESKDLQAYRPYAFSESEVMLGKGFSALLTTLMGIFPIVVYLVVLQIQAGQAIWLAIPVVLISMLVLFSTLIFLILVGVHFITKTAIFRKYKKLASNLLLALASLMAFAAIVLVNVQNSSSRRGMLAEQPAYFPPLQVFHDFGLNPFSSSALLGMGAWVLVALILLALIRFKVLPEFYEAAVATTASVSKQKRNKSFTLHGIQNFPQFVWRYQLNLISEGSVFLQSILMSSIMPYVFLFPLLGFVFNSPQLVDQFMTFKYAFPLILIAIMIGAFNAGGANLTAIGISLERENYDYLKVLPFDMKRYLELKFWHLFILQSILPCLLFLIFHLVARVPLPLILLMFLAWGLTCLPLSAWGYHHDKKFLVTNWSNVTELFNRGNNTLKALLAIVIMIVYVIIVLLSAILIRFTPDYVGYLLAIFAILALLLTAFFSTRHYLKKVNAEVGD